MIHGVLSKQMTTDTKVNGKMAKSMEKENFSTSIEGSYTLECGVTTFLNVALLKILVDMKPPSQQHTHYPRLVLILYIVQEMYMVDFTALVIILVVV